MTDVANKYGKLNVDDVNLCYDKEYHMVHMQLTAIQPALVLAVHLLADNQGYCI